MVVHRSLKTVSALVSLALSSLVIGCSSVPEENSPEKAALLSNPPKEIVAHVEFSFRKKIAMMDAAEIETYLTKVASRLFGTGNRPMSVSLVSTATAGYDPSIWAVPSGKLFVDVRVLRALHFENELAAGMVLAWELSEGSEFRERLITEGGKTDPDPRAVWTAGELEYQKAIESSVDRIYKAGYDPRGLVSYFDRSAGKEKASAENEARKEKSRRTIAFYAPLLNPIVHTEDFHKMKKRLERL